MEPQEPHYSLAVGHRKRHKAFTLIRPLASLTKGDGNVANEPLVRSSGKVPDAFQELAKAFSRWMSSPMPGHPQCGQFTMSSFTTALCSRVAMSRSSWLCRDWENKFMERWGYCAPASSINFLVLWFSTEVAPAGGDAARSFRYVMDLNDTKNSGYERAFTPKAFGDAQFFGERLETFA